MKLSMEDIIAIRRKKYEEQQAAKQAEEETQLRKIMEQEKAQQEENIRQEKIYKWGKKYSIYFNTNPQKRAAYIICKALTRYYRWDVPSLIPSDDIPGMFRFRVVLTSRSQCEYSEDPEFLYDTDIQIHRIIYQSIVEQCPEPIYRGDIVMDIRELYAHKNEPIVVNNMIFYLQPQDHIRLEKQFNKIHGETPASVRFLQQLEYDRGLCEDYRKECSTKEHL